MNIKEERRSDNSESYPSSPPLLGTNLDYDEGFHGYEESDEDGEHYAYNDWSSMGDISKKTISYGIPHRVTGHLGCGCSEAFLHGMGKETPDGHLETDYICDYGYHNYIVYIIERKERSNTRKKIIKDGQITYGEADSEIAPLGEY